MKHAFRCRNCGTLETSGNAGERPTPAACRICGFGVSFDPLTGLKNHHEDNWQVLAELSATELEKLGLTADDIEAHVPAAPGDPDHEPQVVERSAEDGLASEDRPS